MTDMFYDLAEKCRRSAGPCRVLDGLIFKAVEEKPGDVWTLDVGDDGVWMRQDPQDRVAYDTPRQYTASVDAALTLLPPGVHISAQFDMPDEGCDTAASVVISYGEDRLGSGLAETPALAICTAALRARDALGVVGRET